MGAKAHYETQTTPTTCAPSPRSHSCSEPSPEAVTMWFSCDSLHRQSISESDQRLLPRPEKLDEYSTMSRGRLNRRGLDGEVAVWSNSEHKQLAKALDAEVLRGCHREAVCKEGRELNRASVRARVRWGSAGDGGRLRPVDGWCAQARHGATTHKDMSNQAEHAVLGAELALATCLHDLANHAASLITLNPRTAARIAEIAGHTSRLRKRLGLPSSQGLPS